MYGYSQYSVQLFTTYEQLFTTYVLIIFDAFSGFICLL